MGAFCLFAFLPEGIAAEAFVSVAEQKKLDAGKRKILELELSKEQAFYAEKQQLLAIAEAEQSNTEVLQAEIRQHASNIKMLREELKMSISTGEKEKKPKKAENTPKKNTGTSQAWDTYSRPNPTINNYY